MYNCTFLNVKEMQTFLGLGRNTVLRLCKDRVENFPAVKVGNRYQAKLDMLTTWRDDWYKGKFEI